MLNNNTASGLEGKEYYYYYRSCDRHSLHVIFAISQ